MELTETQKALIALLKRQDRGKAVIELAILALLGSQRAMDQMLIWAYDNPEKTEEEVVEKILALRDNFISSSTTTET